MAIVKIVKKDGTSTRYFWSDNDTEGQTKTVYKKADDGVKRMRGVRFNPVTNRMRRV